MNLKYGKSESGSLLLGPRRLFIFISVNQVSYANGFEVLKPPVSGFVKVGDAAGDDGWCFGRGLRISRR